MLRQLALLALFSAPLLAASNPASAITDEEREKICTKAEERYQELFGKPSADEDVTIVKMYKYTFCPHDLMVKKGTKVRWVNVDKRTSHSVWFQEAGKEESERLFSEETVDMTFDMPAGAFPYICGPHHKQEGMTGTVTVVD